MWTCGRVSAGLASPCIPRKAGKACRGSLHRKARRGCVCPALSESASAASRQRLFDNIAPVYDQLNDALSLGQHRVWKKLAVRWSGAKQAGRLLDVCCGSGDLAFLLAAAAGPKGRVRTEPLSIASSISRLSQQQSTSKVFGEVAAVDFSAEMLEYARQRGHDRAAADSSDACIQWIQGDALDLPFSSEQFDAATVGYGLRNVSCPGQALRELCRVLKPGSKAAILDFNNSSNIFASRFQSWALQNIVVPMAESYGLGAEYEYLEPSIQRFPKGDEQESLALDAGFGHAIHYEIAFGLMGILIATK